MSTIELAPRDIGTIYCVGRNYVAHAKELNNPVPDEPVIFTKARSSVCPLSGSIALPQALNRCDHETEIAVRLGHDLYQTDESTIVNGISHIGMALDLTLREKQTELKQQKYPWDLAKTFTNACPLSPMLVFDHNTMALNNLEFSLHINGEIRQQGNSSDMLFSIVKLIQFLAAKIPLMAGDLILTGTPEGVGPLNHGDELVLTLQNQMMGKARIERS